jgi:hypothetical protein
MRVFPTPEGPSTMMFDFSIMGGGVSYIRECFVFASSDKSELSGGAVEV